MTLTQSIVPVIIFWAIIGGLGASLLLPSMQSLIHGNFEGKAQTRVYALVGASAAIAAAVGPLIGGFITTFLSWRLAFLRRGGHHRRRPVGTRPRQGRAVHGSRDDRPRRRASSRSSAWAASSSGILAWQEGGESVARAHRGRRASRWPSFAWWLVRRKRAGKAALIDPDLFKSAAVPARDLRADAPADRARRPDDRAADLPPDGLRVQRAAGRPLDRAAVAEHVRHRARWPDSGPAGSARARSSGSASCCSPIGVASIIPIVPRADAGWQLALSLIVAGSGLGPARLAAQQLHARRRSARSGSARRPA